MQIKKWYSFNGNFEISNKEFDDYLNFHKYKFKEDANEKGGYVFIKKQKILFSG